MRVIHVDDIVRRRRRTPWLRSSVARSAAPSSSLIDSRCFDLIEVLPVNQSAKGRSRMGTSDRYRRLARERR